MIDSTSSAAFIWQLQLVSLVLQSKSIIETKLIKVNYRCVSHEFTFILTVAVHKE